MTLWYVNAFRSDYLTLATGVQDNTYYYLLPAWNFSRHGWFTFDGLTRTYGFQPLWEICLSIVAFAASSREMLLRTALALGAILYGLTAFVPSRSDLAGSRYKAEEVNEFLVHLNGCAERNVFVIAATNQPDLIDPAVRRTGRLDKHIYVGPPDLEARREMLGHHLEGRPVSHKLTSSHLLRSFRAIPPATSVS